MKILKVTIKFLLFWRVTVFPVSTDVSARERVATNKRIARQPPANHRQVVSSVYTCLAALHCVRAILLFLPGLKWFFVVNNG